MKIPNLPSEINDLLFDYHRYEILKKVQQPIVTLLGDLHDPTWKLVDSLLTSENLILDMSENRTVQVTVHEILPGVNAVWIMDDFEYEDSADDVGEAIIINALDLELILEGGFDALVQYHLFKSF